VRDRDARITNRKPARRGAARHGTALRGGRKDYISGRPLSDINAANPPRENMQNLRHNCWLPVFLVLIDKLDQWNFHKKRSLILTPFVIF